MLVLALLATSAALAAAVSNRIYLPQPNGKYGVGKTQLIIDHTTFDDPMASPESNYVGSFFVVNVLYPTENATSEDILLKYMDDELAEQFEADWQIPTGKLQKLYTHIQWQSPIRSFGHGEKRLPTLLFSPGAGMGCTTSTIVQAEMASHGYTVVCIDHPGESPYLRIPQTDSGVYGIPINYEWDDIKFGYRVNEIRKSDLDVLIRLAPVILKPYVAASNGSSTSTFLHFGFSMGGSIGTHLLSTYDSVLTGVNYDGSFLDSLFGHTVDVEKPFLMLRNDQGMDSDPSWDMFEAAQTGCWQHLKIANTHHHDFSDVSMWMDLLELRGRTLGIDVGTISGERMREIMTEFTIKFFDKILSGKALRLDTQLPSIDWPDVSFVNGSMGI